MAARHQYLVHCAACDRAFWQDEQDAPLPAHSAWERRAATTYETGPYCEGSLRAGEWIAEGDGPLTGRPATPPRPAGAASPGSQ
jgi:hypothetical protein